MKIALGTAQFGLIYGVANQSGQVPHEEAQAILQYAKESGIDTLDTAIIYGESEQRLGAIGVQDWEIISKLPEVSSDCPNIAKWVEEEVQASLRRLKRKNLSALLLHRPQQLLENNGKALYTALQRIKKDGLVEKIGISIYTPEELEALYQRKYFEFDLVQAPFNVIDRRLIQSGWLKRLSDLGIELHVRSVFLQGLLLMTEKARPPKFDRWKQLWRDWHEWLNKTGLTPMEACIRYALSFPEIDRVIVGVDTKAQLMEILQAAKGSTPEVSEHIQSNFTELLNPAYWPDLT